MANDDQDFVAKVALQIDETSLTQISQKIKTALEQATKGVDIQAIKDLAAAMKTIADTSAVVTKATKERTAAGKEELATKKQQEAAEKELVRLSESVLKSEASKVALDNKRLAAATILKDTLASQLLTEERLARQASQNNEAAQKALADKKQLAAEAKALAEIERSQLAAQKESTRLTEAALKNEAAKVAAENKRLAQASLLKDALTAQLLTEERQTRQLNESAKAAQQLADAALKVNANFNLGAVGGALGNNFLTTLLSGGGVKNALTSSLSQLQPALFGIAQGGEKATAAFADLGIVGTGTVGALTSGMAALGLAALVVIPAVGELGKALYTAFNQAYEQQKLFIFNSGLLSKQLGTTAEEGAKLRALLTVVGQEDNIFAAITLNQIQASVAGLDRFNKGLEVASPQVTKFGQALTQLGVDYKKGNGDLKTFAELVVDISAGLEKLSTAQRSLAIQNLAGLFGGDVAKIFGFGPDGLSSILQNSVVLTEAQVKANDDLQISAALLTAAQTQLNITLTEGVVPLETYFNILQASTLREVNDELGVTAKSFLAIAEALGLIKGFSPELLGDKLLNVIPKIGDLNPFGLEGLQARADSARAIIARLNADLTTTSGLEEIPIVAALAAAVAELEILEKRIAILTRNKGGIAGILGAVDAGASAAALTKQYKELEGAVKDVVDAEKDIADVQKEVAKNNEDVAKSFEAQFGALRKAADGYDAFYTKLKDIDGKIGELKNLKYRSRGQKEELAQLEEQRIQIRVEFLQGGFDVAKQTFDNFIQGIAGSLSPDDLKAVLAGGAGVLQDYADQLGLFSTPGFAQALGEAGLNAKFLAGGFGDLTTAAGKVAAFEAFTAAFGNLRKELLDLSPYIADPELLNLDTIFKDLKDFEKDPKRFKIPIAIELGLVTAYDVKLADFTGDFAPVIDEAIQGITGTRPGDETISVEAQQAAQKAAQEKLAGIGTSKGLVERILGGLGLNTGEAISATLQFTLDAKVDTSLPDKQIKAAAELLKAQNNQRTIALKWNIKIEPTMNTAEVLAFIQAQIAAIVGGTYVPPRTGISGTITTQPLPVPVEFNAAGGDVMRGIPSIVGEGGKPELFVPRSDGRIIPGNETASLMRLLGGTQRTPAVPSITYAPVSYQNLTVDARGTNARDVTQAIKRTQAKQSLFTSSSAIVRDRDFLRSHGIR